MQDIHQALAQKLRYLRQEQGLSLDELVRRSGVSKGMLVEIEKARANPSIAILCKIAVALGVSVAELVEVSEQSTIRHVEPAVLWRGPHGGNASLLAGSRGPQMLELWRWLIKPGESYDSGAHPQGCLELLHVVAGVLSLTVGDQHTELVTGGSVIAHTDQAHRYFNTGPEDVVFFMVVLEPHFAARAMTANPVTTRIPSSLETTD